MRERDRCRAAVALGTRYRQGLGLMIVTAVIGVGAAFVLVPRAALGTDMLTG